MDVLEDYLSSRIRLLEVKPSMKGMLQSVKISEYLSGSCCLIGRCSGLGSKPWRRYESGGILLDHLRKPLGVQNAVMNLVLIFLYSTAYQVLHAFIIFQNSVLVCLWIFAERLLFVINIQT